MSLLWISVSGILAFELIVFFIMCAPFPWGVRKNISRWIFRMKAHERLDIFFKYILAALLIAFLESAHGMYNLQMRSEFRAPASTGSDGAAAVDPQHAHSVQMAGLCDLRWRRARLERNMYMAAFAIALGAGIVRLVRLASIEVQLRAKIKTFNGNRPLTETGETVPGYAANSSGGSSPTGLFDGKSLATAAETTATAKKGL